MAEIANDAVLTVQDAAPGSLVALLANYELSLVVEKDGARITGSYWGEPEAGIVGKTVYVRRDTPIHSLLHESCHVICMAGSLLPADRSCRLLSVLWKRSSDAGHGCLRIQFSAG